MFLISKKVKNIFLFSIKILVVFGAFYFVYYQLAHNEQLDWKKFLELIERKKSFLGIFFLLSLSFLNRFLEILKWQNLVQVIRKITVLEATEQVLAALTASIFTPNGIGEYGAKALYFKKDEAKNVVFLNLICNGIQMVLTVIFGTLGLLFLGYGKWVLVILGVAGFFAVAYSIFKNSAIKGYSLRRLFEKINLLPKKIHQKNALLALLRYLVFSHQYYFLFLVFDVDLPYLTLMATIATVYFLASALPTFQFLDFAVKGSVAVFFFGNLGVNEWIVVFIATLMWFLNVVLPVLIGGFYVLKFKPRWKS